MLVAIHQPNFLPRPKVLDKLLAADLVIWLDDVQWGIGALALTLAWVGAVIHRAFGDLLFALMVQGSPFVSMLTVKYGYHIKPDHR